MALIDEIKQVKGLYIRCPNCSGEFRASSAQLFDARRALPEEAAALLEERKATLRTAREGLAREKGAIARATVTAETVNLGKVVEKIATALPGFHATPTDCRSLLEPIDLLIFEGLTRTGAVERIHFTEVKSGAARLNGHQRQIREAVGAGKVDFAVEDLGGTP